MSMWPDNFIIYPLFPVQDDAVADVDAEMPIIDRPPTPAEAFRLKCEQLMEAIFDDFYQEGLTETRAELALDPRAQELWEEAAAAEQRFAHYLRGRLESGSR